MSRSSSHSEDLLLNFPLYLAAASSALDLLDEFERWKLTAPLPSLD